MLCFRRFQLDSDLLPIDYIGSCSVTELINTFTYHTVGTNIVFLSSCIRPGRILTTAYGLSHTKAMQDPFHAAADHVREEDNYPDKCHQNCRSQSFSRFCTCCRLVSPSVRGAALGRMTQSLTGPASRMYTKSTVQR